MAQNFSPPSIVTGWGSNSSSNNEFTGRYKEHWRLISVLHGGGRSRAKNQAISRIGRGEMILLGPDEEFVWEVPSGFKGIGIVFSFPEKKQKKVKKSLTPMGSKKNLLWGSPIQNVIPQKVAKNLSAHVEMISSLWWTSEHNKLRANALLSIVLLDLLEHWFPSNGYIEPKNLRSTNHQKILTAEKLARNKLSSWRVEDMAKAVKLNRSNFTRLYIQERGRSPGSWLDEARLALAKSMLFQEKYPLKQIAAWCGKPRPQSFCRWFKMRTGLTPKEYRE